LKITPNRRNARQNLIDSLLPIPPNFSLPSTFKESLQHVDAERFLWDIFPKRQ
jgi:hypothetical protein